MRLKHPLGGSPNAEMENLEKKARRSLWVVTFFMFVAGLGMGFGLLTAKVNVTFFFFLFIALPFFASLFAFAYSLTSLLSNEPSSKSGIIQWAAKFFFESSSMIPHDVLKSLIFIRLQQGSLALLFGTLLALFMTLLGKYVSFGWESTILDASYMQSVVNAIALPWSGYLPSAVPSIEMIQGSDYSNPLMASQSVEKSLISQSWYKFLALALLFYGVAPRLILLCLAHKIYDKALRKNILDAVPNITTTIPDESFHERDEKRTEGLTFLESHEESSFDCLIGWSYNQEELQGVIQNKKISAPLVKLAGGNVPIEEENALVSTLRGAIVVLVPSWEPPRKDFVNFVKALLKNEIQSIFVYPIGEERRGFAAEPKNVSIWESKIKTIESPKVGLYHE